MYIEIYGDHVTSMFCGREEGVIRKNNVSMVTLKPYTYTQLCSYVHTISYYWQYMHMHISTYVDWQDS